MARIVVAGAGVVGASIAYNLALRGADEVVLADTGRVAGGATGKAMGGVRQQFTTRPEVALARASVRFFESLGEPLFEQVGYLFLATTDEGARALDDRLRVQRALGVPVERVDPAFVPGLRADDVQDAVFCAEDGVADPAGITRELVRRGVELGVEVHEETAAEDLERDLLVLACGARSAEVAARLGVELPIRPLVRQLLETGPLDVPERLPMTIEAESGFHFRRRGDRLVLAMTDAEPRWGWEESVDELVYDDRLARLVHRFPPAAGARIEDAWAGLYDMTPDAHPILGQVADDVYAACGFSGHGFMQAPAVGRIVADELLAGGSDFDLTPYRLDRFADGTIMPETAIL